MAYNSAYTGPQVDEAVGAVAAIRSLASEAATAAGEAKSAAEKAKTAAEAVDRKLTDHAGDTVKHVTAGEKAAWNGKAAPFGPEVVNVLASGWAGAGPWTQTVTVAGVTAAMDHIGIYPVDIADTAARKAYEKAYGCLAAEAETVAGGILLTCRDAKPETDFQVKVQGVR